jgi:hypothetical protein
MKIFFGITTQNFIWDFFCFNLSYVICNKKVTSTVDLLIFSFITEVDVNILHFIQKNLIYFYF